MTHVVARSLSCGLVLAAMAAASWGANQSVSVAGLSFSPKHVTINAGESVTWTNNGGLHNVVADDGGFRCANGCDGEGGNGAPSAANWSFTRTFSTPGVIGYFCEVHGASGGIGMSGTVTVLATGSPGLLRLASAELDGSEGGGPVTVVVQRTGGTSGAVAVSYSTADGSALAGSDYAATSGTLSWANGESADKSFTVAIIDDSEVEGPETFTVSLSAPTGGASLGSPAVATVTVTSNDTPGSAGSLAFTAGATSVNENGGTVTLSLARTGGSTGSVSVDWSTAAGSATAGADFTAASGTVSFGDGETGPKTIAIGILDDTNEEPAESFSVALSSPSGGASLGSPASATVTINDNDSGGPCIADSRTLCLNGGRFRVRMRWTDFQSNVRDALAFPFRTDSAFFYFVDDTNLEMIVKVLNACGVNSRFWVFFAAASNTGYELSVTDTTITHTTKVYTNPVGTFAPATGDTDAFGGCP